VTEQAMSGEDEVHVLHGAGNRHLLFVF